MNTAKKPRQARICVDCGAPFMTSAKFGNEECCDVCYKREEREFYAWLDQQPNDVLVAALHDVRRLAAEWGVPLDDEVADIVQVEQDDIDSAFYELMRGVL